jgi:hypothetical protein
MFQGGVVVGGVSGGLATTARNGGSNTASGSGNGRSKWVLREYEFVDTLILQLEDMKPTQRRKVLMALQYALSAADPKQVHIC